MLKTKPVRIDDQLYALPPHATVADVVPAHVQSVITPAGALITRERFASVPVPEGFDTNLSVINKGADAASGGLTARPGKRGAKMKIRYVCPGCGVRVWGLSGISVICRDCGEPLQASGPAHSPRPLPDCPSLNLQTELPFAPHEENDGNYTRRSLAGERAR